MSETDDYSVYFSSERFDAETVPEKLLRDHTLKAGVHGRLVVFEGEVELWIDGDPPTHERVLPGDTRVHIPPERPHRIRVHDGTTFQLELMRRARG